MADEEVVPPEVVAEAPAEVQPELPLSAEPKAPVAEATPETPVEVTPEPPKEIWQDKELKAKHRQNKDLQRALAEKDAEIATKNAMLAKFNQAPAETPLVPADEVQRQVQEGIAKERYIEQSQKVARTGEDTYKEAWKDAVSNLEILGGFDQSTMNGVLATDDPAKVLYELGKSPEKYHEIMALPLERRIIEMGKLAMQPATKPISGAPVPITTVGGRAAPAKDTLNDKMDDDQWFAIRRKQRMDKFNAAHSPRR